MELVAIAAIVLALAFDFVNGFHDTANAVATVIYSKALRPRVAIGMSAALNFLGALTVGTSVALFVTNIVPLSACSLTMIMSVLIAGLIWNLGTWYCALPVSSTHCLIGSLVGAGIAAQGIEGIHLLPLYKAGAALVVSPAIGFFACMLISRILSRGLAFADRRTHLAHKALPWLQIASSASVSFSHGSNDGQKTMGIVTLILATQFAAYGYTTSQVPFWVVFAAASAIGLGTAIGGWRIIRTVGEKLSHKPIDAVHGCAAEFSTAATVLGASHLGVPVSTTHTLTSAVMGGTVGLHGTEHTNGATMRGIFLAWILTLPVTAGLSWLIYTVSNAVLG